MEEKLNVVQKKIIVGVAGDSGAENRAGGTPPSHPAPKAPNLDAAASAEPAATAERGGRSLAPELDLASLDVEVLMQGLAASAPARRNSVETWAEAEGYYPGSTRVPGRVLYAKYVDWLAANPEAGKPLHPSPWGKAMTARFKRGKARLEYFYYTSRESLSEIEAQLNESGIGTAGGAGPGGPGASKKPQ